MTVFSRFSTWHVAVLDRFIPDNKIIHNEDLRRARLLVGIIVYGVMLNSALVIIRYQTTQWSSATISAALGSIILTVLLLLYYRTKKLNIISDIVVASALITLSFTIYNDGGLMSRGIIWLTVFPITSQSIAHKVKAKETLLISWAVIIAVYHAHSIDLIFTPEPMNFLFGRAISLAIVLLFVTIVTLIYDNSRQLLNEQLITEKENAEQAYKEKSQFLATMSHELRTPFNGVLGILELLSDSSLTDQQRHRVGLAKTSAESLLLLINDILDFSKIEAGKQDIESIDFDLHKLLGDTVEAMAYQANNKGIEIILNTHHAEQCTYIGDPNRIRQITTNLISNAIKFTSEGHVIINVNTTNINGNYTLSVSVQDSGIGIPEEKLNILFNSFTQVDASTSRKYGGSGLGLAIAKNLSELMGGNISVTSTEHVGSTFEFHINLLKSNKSIQQAKLPNLENKHIIAVDNNEHVLSCIKNLLHNTHANLKCFNSPESAKKYIQIHDTPKVDLLLIDINMPNINGIQFIKDLKNPNALLNTKITMMTEINTIDGEELLTEIGVDFSFPKPITFSDMSNTLKQLEPKHCISNEKIQINTESINLNEYKTDIHILIVDDNPINLEVAAALLDSFDIQPVLATGAHEAIKILSNHPKKDFIHGILMDCQMPIMDGFEATKAIREGAAGSSYKNIPIIALTANAMKSDREKCISSGMDDFLTKPIDINKLINAIDVIVKPNLKT